MRLVGVSSAFGRIAKLSPQVRPTTSVSLDILDRLQSLCQLDRPLTQGGVTNVDAFALQYLVFAVKRQGIDKLAGNHIGQ